jgi:Choline dehydrogenase and related flavoproteins
MTDVVVIGSGAGGAPLALRLSQAGFHVTVLEKGARHVRGDFRQEEVIVPSQDPFVPLVHDEPHMLVDHRAADAAPKRGRFGWIACCVGGGTVHMGGSLLRFHPDDFRVASRCGAYEEIADWPISYDELEPYYSQAEWEVGVSGAGGVNPFDGFRSRDYPMPPLCAHPLAHALERAGGALGLHPYPTPRAVNSRPYAGRPACAHCDFCAGYGCPTGARGSMSETLLPRAEATGRCDVVANAMVREVTTDGRARVSGCIYIDADGVERHISADVVCVACSAIESARLLLLSKPALWPDGLMNDVGLVGRHLQFHVGSMARGRFRRDAHPELALRDRDSVLGRAIMDFYFRPPGISPLGKGGVLTFDLGRVHPVGEALRIATREGDRLLWGRALQERLEWVLRDSRTVALEVFQDFVPNRGTFVELDPTVVDRWGIPVARIHLTEPAHHRAAGAWLVERGLELFDTMGADEALAGGIGYTNDVMCHGTCRAGSDPRTSVLTPFCQSHRIPNLFVVDGSFMPTSGGAPSTLTIIANSLRIADFIIDRAKSRDFG